MAIARSHTHTTACITRHKGKALKYWFMLDIANIGNSEQDSERVTVGHCSILGYSQVPPSLTKNYILSKLQIWHIHTQHSRKSKIFHTWSNHRQCYITLPVWFYSKRFRNNHPVKKWWKGAIIYKLLKDFIHCCRLNEKMLQ